MHFESALQLAVQRAAHKWTYVNARLNHLFTQREMLRYEDFMECFPLYTSEDKDSSMAVFQQISSFIETESLVGLTGSVHVLHLTVINRKHWKTYSTSTTSKKTSTFSIA